MPTAKYEYEYHVTAFVPDALGWRVAVTFEKRDGGAESSVHPVMGWCTVSEFVRVFDWPDERPSVPSGSTEVMAGVINTWDGGDSISPISALREEAGKSYQPYTSVDYWLLAPGEAVPEGFEICSR